MLLTRFKRILEHRTASKQAINHITGDNMNLGKFLAVTRDRASVELDQKCIRAMEDGNMFVNQMIKEGHHIYGVSTGFGGSADTKVESKDLGDSLMRHLSVKYGASLPIEISRGLMYMRANNSSKAYSGIRPYIAQNICWLLNAKVTPMLPERGTISASGDLSTTVYLANLLAGIPSTKA